MKNPNELFQLRNVIIDKALIIGYTFAFLSYVVTIFRAVSYGFDFSFAAIPIGL